MTLFFIDSSSQDTVGCLLTLPADLLESRLSGLIYPAFPPTAMVKTRADSAPASVGPSWNPRVASSSPRLPYICQPHALAPQLIAKLGLGLPCLLGTKHCPPPPSFNVYLTPEWSSTVKGWNLTKCPKGAGAHARNIHPYSPTLKPHTCKTIASTNVECESECLPVETSLPNRNSLHGTRGKDPTQERRHISEQETKADLCAHLCLPSTGIHSNVLSSVQQLLFAGMLR